jgi:hypothetical protein
MSKNSSIRPIFRNSRPNSISFGHPVMVKLFANDYLVQWNTFSLLNFAQNISAELRNEPKQVTHIEFNMHPYPIPPYELLHLISSNWNCINIYLAIISGNSSIFQFFEITYHSPICPFVCLSTSIKLSRNNLEHHFMAH